MSDTILTRRFPAVVYRRPDGALFWDAGMAIDADGDPRSYHPNNKLGLDDYRNAGFPDHPSSYRDILVCGPDGKPVLQGPEDAAPGYFISKTAYEHDHCYPEDNPRRYLWSSVVRYVVIPGALRRMVGPVVLGCLAEASYKGKSVPAVVGDIGSDHRIGEASMAVARALGIDENPRTGGCASGVRYVIYPGVAAPGHTLKPA